MQFIKTHLIALVCGVAAVGFIVAAVMGMRSDAVVKAMDKRIQETNANQIKTLTASAKNKEVIDKEIARGKQFQDEFDRTLKAAQEINRRAPLMDGVFPAPAELVTPFEFREQYARAMEQLPKMLISAGMLPNAADIQEAQQTIDDMRANAAQSKEEQGTPEAGAGQTPGTGRTGAAPPAPTTPSPRSPGTTGRAPMMSDSAAPIGRGMGARGGAMGDGMAGLSAAEQADPKFNAVYRARVDKARSLRCYYNEATFQASPILDPRSGPPRPADMWMAQVALWVQQDVAAAVAALNKEAAEKVKDAEPFVENVPVKHLVAVRVQAYVLPDGKLVPFSTTGTADPVHPSFTGRGSNDQFDVLRFQVQVVMDQRDILRLVDQISKQNFYRPLNIWMDPVPAGLDAAAGYLYGTAPVSLVTLDFEGFMSRAVFDAWMPKDVRARLSGQKPGE